MSHFSRDILIMWLSQSAEKCKYFHPCPLETFTIIQIYTYMYIYIIYTYKVLQILTASLSHFVWIAKQQTDS